MTKSFTTRDGSSKHNFTAYEADYHQNSDLNNCKPIKFLHSLYQFPFQTLHIDPPNPPCQGGSKKVSVASIKEIGIRSQRPSKTRCIVIDEGAWIKLAITPDDHDTVVRILREKTSPVN
jgi:hypothetical protein